MGECQGMCVVVECKRFENVFVEMCIENYKLYQSVFCYQVEFEEVREFVVCEV